MTLKYSSQQEKNVREKVLIVDPTSVQRIPEVLARLAARKKGTTLSEGESQQIKSMYARLRMEGKIQVRHRGELRKAVSLLGRLYLYTTAITFNTERFI